MKNWIGFFLIAAHVLAIQVLVGLVLWNNIDTSEARGQFGDMFGAVNALFAGLAFAGVVWAIVLQHRELNLQRKDLKLTHEELRAARAVYEAQEQHMAEQKNIAMHSSMASQVADICRLRNELIVEYYQMTSDKQRIAVRECLNASAPLLTSLLNWAQWEAKERAGFAKLAGARSEVVEEFCIIVDPTWFTVAKGEDPISKD